jgi:hypothetical protein
VWTYGLGEPTGHHGSWSPLDPADVAAVVYPPETFDVWDDDQEPDLPTTLRVV